MSIENEQLAPNFHRWEFCCPCGCGNMPVDSRLIDALQKLRELVGRPITISSGYRCRLHNKSLSGASQTSRHITAEAADIFVMGMDIGSLFLKVLMIEEFRNGGIGVYRDEGFIHVDVRTTGAARWGKYDESDIKYL